MKAPLLLAALALTLAACDSSGPDLADRPLSGQWATTGAGPAVSLALKFAPASNPRTGDFNGPVTGAGTLTLSPDSTRRVAPLGGTFPATVTGAYSPTSISLDVMSDGGGTLRVVAGRGTCEGAPEAVVCRARAEGVVTASGLTLARVSD